VRGYPLPGYGLKLKERLLIQNQGSAEKDSKGGVCELRLEAGESKTQAYNYRSQNVKLRK
jgi:hypothetical protein